jgi:hypothetical protein
METACRYGSTGRTFEAGGTLLNCIWCVRFMVRSTAVGVSRCRPSLARFARDDSASAAQQYIALTPLYQRNHSRTNGYRYCSWEGLAKYRYLYLVVFNTLLRKVDQGYRYFVQLYHVGERCAQYTRYRYSSDTVRCTTLYTAAAGVRG